MSYITKQFTYNIPDEYLSDKFTKGLTGSWSYKGPEVVYLQIDKETGKEVGWCLWEPRDLERPCPLNCERIKLECTKDPLLAHICNDLNHPEEEAFRRNKKWVVFYQAPAGYESILKPDSLEPRDIYDAYNIKYNFNTKEFILPVRTFELLYPGSSGYTWDTVRAARNKALEDTDGKVSPDMPKSIQEKWQTYRNLLRDLPDALAEFPPHLAIHMFPKAPVSQPIAAFVATN